MQEWVETLRQKLREMKILSPKENLYSKLPEIRPPLLPTRDPTSPLPAPPPVPAALVPGIERIPAISSSISLSQTQNNTIRTIDADTELSNIGAPITTTLPATVSAPVPTTSAMSNTLTQNLINMLSNPVSAYSNHLSTISSDTSSTSLEDSFFFEDDQDVGAAASQLPLARVEVRAKKELFQKSDNLSSLAKTFADNVLADPNTCPSTSTGSANNSSALHGMDGGCSSSSANDPGKVLLTTRQSSILFFFQFYIYQTPVASTPLLQPYSKQIPLLYPGKCFTRFIKLQNYHLTANFCQLNRDIVSPMS